MRLRSTLILVCAGFLPAGGARGAEPTPPPSPPVVFTRAETQPAKTKLLLNTVLLTTTGFERKGATYETGYAARVSPLSFLSETGKITIDVTNDQLMRLERGEAVPFTGLAVSKGGDRHTISGTAVPADKTRGTLRVRISTSIVDLKFETPYRFIGEPTPASAPAAAPTSPP